MFTAISPSEAAAAERRFAPVRADGRIRVGFAVDNGVTSARDVSERGGFRVRMPVVEGMREAVLINTGGGMTGGDRLTVEVAAEQGASAVVTTQSAEKVYRSNGPEATVQVSLAAGPGARLHWLPQETILFSGARLARRLEADVSARSELLLAETIVYGRLASGEAMAQGSLFDRWRIRRDNRLVFAENLRLDGDIGSLLARPALGGGARAATTLLYLAEDAGARLDEARELLSDAACEAGAGVIDGLLVVRLLGADPQALRLALHGFLRGFRGESLPRVW